MSTFTRFEGNLHISYDDEASELLDIDYWLLEKSFTYYIGEFGSDEFITVPAGFLSDGASVPLVGRALIPAMGKHSQAAFLHDYLCETYVYSRKEEGSVVAVELTRVQVDQIFHEALEVIGFPKWKRTLVILALFVHRTINNPTKPIVDPVKKELQDRYTPIPCYQ